jgi:hypothetical protein
MLSVCEEFAWPSKIWITTPIACSMAPAKRGCSEARKAPAEVEESIRILTELSKQKYVPPYNIAIVHAGLGEFDAALGWLEKAYETRDVRLTFLAVEPKWDTMRSEPGFQSLLKRLALPLDASLQALSNVGTPAKLAVQQR